MADTTPIEFVLGIDLGTNSLGWAVVGLIDGEPANLIRAGVRVFDAGMDDTKGPGNEESRNKTRRDARLHRRQLWRHRRRLVKVAHFLQRFGLLPEGNVGNGEERQDFLNRLDAQILGSNWFEAKERSGLYPDPKQVMPYILRAAALDEPLELHFLGRALYHLAQRRGFLSNRRQAPQKDKDQGPVKEGIADLRKAMQESKARTLGEYFSRLAPSAERIRARWTHRDMYEEEFKAVWDAQANHHPGLLTEDLRKELYHAIFYQRPLWFDPNTIGQCDLEPGRPRAAKYLLISQRFRLLQKVNDLQIEEPGELPRYLTPEERAKLSEALELQGDLPFHKDRKANGHVLPSVRALLGLPRNVSFNLQRGGEEKMPGNRTTSEFHAVFGERWLEMSAEEHNQAILDVLSIQKPEALKRRALGHWKLDEQAADRFCQLSLEPDYMNFSRKAIENLLPLLEQGIPLQTARKQIYESFKASDAMPLLPPVEQALTEIRNPAVMRSLTELRKVVNGVVRRYGKPTYVRVELARDLKKSKKQRAALSEINRRNEKARAKAAEEIVKGDVGIKEPKPEDKRKYQLAEECHWQCPYTGKTISMQALFGPEPQFDIEHIVPFSRSMDNSFQNLTLCYVPENRSAKGNKTPNEGYSGHPERYQAILDRVKKFAGERAMVSAKLKRFMMNDNELEEFLEGFRNRQLNDTAYASRLATRYVGLLYGGLADAEHQQRVFAPSGQTTAYFRNLWKLNAILNDGPSTDGGRMAKSRGDHRHHAVDAVVIGLTDAGMVKRLSDAAQRAPLAGRKRFAALEGPWPNFVDTVRQTINRIIVSHRVSKKVSGALHEDTNYSPAEKAGRAPLPPRTRRVIDLRIPGKGLSKAEVKCISDDRIRHIVMERLQTLGTDDPHKAFGNPEHLPFLPNKNGEPVPIKRVRINISDPVFPVGKDERVRYVTTDSNHHVELVGVLDDNGTDVDWDGRVVPMKEAYLRIKSKAGVIDKSCKQGEEYKFSLCPGEVLDCGHADGESRLLVFKGVSQYSAGPVVISLLPLNDARKNPKLIRVVPNTLRKWYARKVNVNPLGEVSDAHD